MTEVARAIAELDSMVEQDFSVESTQFQEKYSDTIENIQEQYDRGAAVDIINDINACDFPAAHQKAHQYVQDNSIEVYQ